MLGRDRIDIEQNGYTLRGAGLVRVTLDVPSVGGWHVVPKVEGVVTFDDRVTSSALEAMNSAEVRVDLADGTRRTFRQAVVIRQDADARAANTYALRLDCYEAVP